MQEDQLSCRLECDVGESAAENKEVVTLGSHPEFLAQQASRRESDERGSQKAATEEIDEGRCSEEVRVSRDRSPSRHSSGKHASRHGSPYPVEVNPRSSRSKSASEGGRRSRGSYSRSLSLDSTERSSTGSSVEEQKLKHKSRDGSDRASSRARHDSTSSSTPLSDYSVE
uniref:Uncharacterized protein n=1 Tax=Parascaris equorum TaxID=6256 RepID=A0A914RPI4_PAREQ